MLRLRTILIALGLAASPALAPAQTPQSGPPSSSFIRELTGDQRPKASGLEQYRCFENEYGWVFSNDTAWAYRAVAEVRRGAAQFEKTFGKAIGRGVVIQKDRMDVGGVAMMAAMGSTQIQAGQGDGKAGGVPGANWIIAWTGIMSPEMLAQFPSTLDSAQKDFFMNSFGVMTHELAHEWFRSSYDWKPGHPAAYGNYSTPGADWLDEAAAITAEDQYQTDQRRDNLRQAVREKSSQVLPLDTLFTMVRTDVGDQPENGDGAFALYDEIRGVMDFFLDRAKGPAILGAVAANEANGSSIAQWLRANGAQYNLPTTMDGLEQEWKTWLAQHRGQ